MNEILRQEKKYLMTSVDSFHLINQLKGVLHGDAHQGTKSYMVRSLYFDTPFDEDAQAKEDGLENRRKLRLRIYDADQNFAMLELKQKQGSMQKKRSLKISREDAIQLIQGNYSVLLLYLDSFALEVYTLFLTRCYRPKVIVEYQRIAFQAKENRIRITFDSNLVASESCFDLFSKDLYCSPIMDPFNSVLEVKYNGFLLSYVKDLLQLANRSEISMSKYMLARRWG